MGYSYYNSHVVYGFCDTIAFDNETELESSWLYEHYEGIQTFAGEINKNFNIAPIIGIIAHIEDDTITYDAAEKRMLDKFVKAYKAYYRKVRGAEPDIVLQFHTAMTGDYQTEGTYTLDD